MPGMAMTPRGAGDPAVAAWVAELLPDPHTVACRVSWIDPATRQPRSRVVTQDELNLAPIDLVWTLRPSEQAAMTDLDDRIVGRVVHAEALRGDTELVIRYTDPVPGTISFFELAPLVDDLRVLLLALPEPSTEDGVVAVHESLLAKRIADG